MTTDDTPLVFVIVLHWQGSHYTRACLASLRALSYPNFKVLLVDNGSPDGSGKSIASQFPEVAFLATGENLGFSGGCNAGIKFCLDAGAEWIWLLNNDTRVDRDSLTTLMKVAQASPDAGALGGVVLSGGGDEFAASGPGEIDFMRAKTYLRQLNSAGAESVKCQWLSGSNLLLRSKALKRTGLFDERYFLYFEDTDLCHRLTRAGWSCLLVPGARVEHAGGASTQGERSYWRAYYYTRNRLVFFLDHAGLLARLPALFSIAGHLVRHAIVLPFRGQAGRNQLRAEMLGLKDYLCRRFGKAACLDWCEDSPKQS